mmetsp:Transcript_1426/g.1944  ORF Transcript_1426/g.1944 Transcript_1426/m.1944 type:complete len:190 (-) Transcript_1426:22-591(-)
MVVIWAVCAFNFYLITFLANTFEQVYVIAFCLSLADLLAYTLSGCLVKRIGTRFSLFYSMLLASIGGVLILAYGLQHEDSRLFPVLFFISKFGTTTAFGTAYVGNTEVFPVEIAASAMGICMVLARVFSSVQFLFMQMAQPAPMIIFTGGSVIAAIFSFMLRDTTTVSAGGQRVSDVMKGDSEAYTRVQ